MLNLQSTSTDRWLAQVSGHVEEFLIDHAHCEKKAASTAMSLLFAYVDNVELCRAMSDIVAEELEHFRMVLDVIERRGLTFRRLRPSSYGARLAERIRPQEPERAVDRLLAAGLIEARSCERFALLRDHLEDAELASFYGSLFEAEARHHSTYVRLAKHFAPEADVRRRLEELAEAEAGIIAQGDEAPRVHS